MHMKDSFALALLLGLCVSSLAGEESPPALKVDISATAGVHCFVPLGSASGVAEIYAFDNPLGGMDAPYQAILGGRFSAQDFGLAVHLSSGYSAIPSGDSSQNSFQLWDAYAWARLWRMTLKVGQLEEYGFRSWIDYQFFLGRDRFGSAGIALEYSGDGLNAIVEIPAYFSGAASNVNTRYFAVYYDSSSVGLDGTAAAALSSLYVAANYTFPRIAAFQAGYQGQGVNSAGYSNGSSFWLDAKYLGLERLTCALEWEGYNVGQRYADGSAVQGLAFGAFALLGWDFGSCSAQVSASFLEGDTSAAVPAESYNLRLQPQVRIPLAETLAASLAARIDNVAGTWMSSQGTGKPSFWLNPELQLSFHGNQVAFGCFFGNDYTGGESGGGSWFFGNTKASTPGYSGSGYTVLDPEYFLDVYATCSFSY